MVIGICIKGSSLRHKLSDYMKHCLIEEGGLDFECMLGNMVTHDGQDAVEELINEIPDPIVQTDALFGFRDCRDWWELEQQADPELRDSEAMLWGRCLSQILSVSCHRRVTDLIRIALS
ncbi:uncharacterized protein [Anabrus simplex]|uniref:uncharacterized protein n=1 Tax=Anabrus simplex TaxID=316456 RepID=UPI0035A2A05B